MLSPFCEECGCTFERDNAKFCRECRTPRGIRPDGTEENRQLVVQTVEGPAEEVIAGDLRGPPARQAVPGHRTGKAPTYNMIFDPPSVQNRVKNKLYGRKCLREDYAIQHKCYNNNHRTTHKWIEEAQSSGLLPQGEFTLEDPLVRGALKKIIDEKHDELMDINFGSGKKYSWKQTDAYKKIKKYLKYKKWRKRNLEKAQGGSTSGNSRANPSMSQPNDLHEFGESVDRNLEDEESHGDEEVDGQDDVTFVMRNLESENVHDMYGMQTTFMMGQNEIATRAKRRPPFPPNSRTYTNEDKIYLVANFFREQGAQQCAMDTASS
ncbi:hypothetical protein KC19_VG178000 [Ceratodon purpureus]|uniref:Uncharacterized protein n=1 Tax=Ceratodon purpureus TaxID=3225 RepID=A0A8T0HS97_CERPU|nr:hypothetical protein KC19_VG178000 [Ceratodon purpureus]